MKKKSSASKRPRLPPDAAGIQVNFCKNPTCANFGVPASSKRAYYRKGESRDDEVGAYYKVIAAGKDRTVIQCLHCGETPTVKSNLGIAEEYFRLRDYLQPPDEPSCTDPACINHRLGLYTVPSCYARTGRTHSGSQRYRCKSCGTTFAVGKSTRGHKRPHKNKQILVLLMNKSPFRRILEISGVSTSTLYKKIDFFYQQSLAFVRQRERRLLEGLPIPELDVSVDRQDYVVNWTQRQDRRNIVLHAAGSADNRSGYIFGMHVNFDPVLNRDEIERAAFEAGDYDVPPAFRRYARAWLQGDYDKAMADFLRGKSQGRKRKSDGSLADAIEETYAEAIARSDVEVSEVKTPSTRLPRQGMQIHAEYTLYAHFQLLHELFGGVGKVNFYLDQDSGMRAACLSAFAEAITAGRADAFYVRLAKEMTVPEKQAALGASRAELRRWQERYPDLSLHDLEFLMIREEMDRMRAIGKWNDRWLQHPFPNMSEPEKAVCYLTDRDELAPHQLAWLYHRASLHGIDRFFMQVRRRLSLLERAIGTASTARRMWHGYSAYNPEMIVKMLTIFRVYYNYCLAGQDKRTPAMRLGLAQGVVIPEGIIYFT